MPACEYNPIEASATQIDGAHSVIDAALDTGVKRALALTAVWCAEVAATRAHLTSPIHAAEKYSDTLKGAPCVGEYGW